MKLLKGHPIYPAWPYQVSNHTVWFLIPWLERSPWIRAGFKLFTALEDCSFKQIFRQEYHDFWQTESYKMHNFDRKFLLWQEITHFDKNIKWKSLLSQSYESKLLKIWKSAWLFINISCDFSILHWKILPTFPVSIQPGSAFFFII